MVQQSEQAAFDSSIVIHNPAWLRALTLVERLKFAPVSDGVARDEVYNRESAVRKLKRWKEQYPFDKDGFFAARLEMDCLSEDDLCFLLGESMESLQARLPEIPTWLRELMCAYEQDTSEELLLQLQKTITAATPVSSHIQMGLLAAALPLISRAVERLCAGAAEIAGTRPALPFDPETLHTLFLPSLPGRVLYQLARTLTLELNVARLEGRLAGDTPQERYLDFVRQLQQREVVLPLLEEYAPLARSLVTTIENWTKCGLEFLERLCTDWNQICQTFFASADPGQLVEVNGSAGDPHKGGRSTLVLRFSSGSRLIYRPKPMAVDVHFQELLHWLNEHGDHLAFRVITVLDRDTYGWAEFVDTASCASQEEVERFYERQGGYLALLYALEATDVHFENLIASGEHPVMIDLESLFHPRVELPMPLPSQYQIANIMSHSVLRIGLLPQRMWGDEEHMGVDISGLGGHGGQLAPKPALLPDLVGTDEMRFIRKRLPMSDKANRPRLHGKDADVLAYRSHLTKGFLQIYRLLWREREALLSGPIQAFAHDEIRLIARPTNIYAQLLLESYHPDLLRNALDRERFFDRLWIAVEQQPRLKRLIAAERADLHAGDIPMFTTHPDRRDIFTSDGTCIPAYLDESSLECVRQRFYSFSEADLSRQLWFIEASLATLEPSEGMMSRKTSRLELTQEIASQERLLQAACKAGDRLVDLALINEHGAGWIGLTYRNEREWQLLPAGVDLYNGAAGIALFLAYLGAITGVDRYTRLARAALLSIQEQEHELRKDAQNMNLGGFDGWGGLIYLYTHLGTLWQEKALLSRAHDIAYLFPALIGQDVFLDIVAGVAGGLLALLTLYHAEPSTELLEIALQCGDQLLRRAVQCGGEALISENGRAPISASQPLTGFAHGAAGMALSLLRLFAISGESRFQQGAQRAMEYERRAFLPAQQNWRDFRTNDLANTRRAALPAEEELCMVAWCHGAPGIGLGRLASLSYQDDPAMREEIEVALQTTVAQGFGMNHSLCHGDLGNLELFLTAAQMLDDARSHDLARTYTAMILNSIERGGWAIPLSIEAPGLMTGIAGIGYQLLRLARPELVPAVLTLAHPSHTLL